jgi:hypothetical protein
MQRTIVRSFATATKTNDLPLKVNRLIYDSIKNNLIFNK